MHVDGYLECNNCPLVDTLHFAAHDTAQMIGHLLRHSRSGDAVPDHVIPELLADDSENFPHDLAPGGTEEPMTLSNGQPSDHDTLVAALAAAGVVPDGATVRRIVVEVDDGKGGLAPDSVESVATAGPQTWGFSATVDWAGAETPTARTGIADFDPPGLIGVDRTIAEDNLSIQYVGTIDADSRQAASDTVMAAAEAVAADSTPAVPGWGASCSVWQ